MLLLKNERKNDNYVDQYNYRPMDNDDQIVQHNNYILDNAAHAVVGKYYKIYKKIPNSASKYHIIGQITKCTNI